MGNIAVNIGKGFSSLLKTLEEQQTARKQYRAAAREQEAQAAYLSAQAQLQNGYLLRSAADKARSTYRDFLQTQGTRRVQTAASGLRSDSATVQYILRNSRFEALLDERAIEDDLQSAVENNNEQLAQQVRALHASAADNRRRALKGLSGWKLANTLFQWMGGN